jgi:hypothetical protein
MKRDARQVTLGSLAGSTNPELYDPAGARTQDLRIKRCQADSLLYDAISTCDLRCDERCDAVHPDTRGASIRRGSLRGHLKPLRLGGGSMGFAR